MMQLTVLLVGCTAPDIRRLSGSRSPSTGHMRLGPVIILIIRDPNLLHIVHSSVEDAASRAAMCRYAKLEESSRDRRLAKSMCRISYSLAYS